MDSIFFIDLLRNLIFFFGSMILLWLISWELTLILFGLGPIFGLFVYFFVKKFINITQNYYDLLAQANGLTNESIQNIKVVKSFATEKKES